MAGGKIKAKIKTVIRSISDKDKTVATPRLAPDSGLLTAAIVTTLKENKESDKNKKDKK